jgi:hypothetical protein
MTEDSSSLSPSISAWTSVPAALLGHRGDVLGILHGRHGGAFHERRIWRAQGLQHVVRPAQQGVPVLGGHAQHVADHDHGQRSGDVVDEVGRALFAHPVDDGIADGADALFALADAFGGEALADQATAAHVFGGIEVDHHWQGVGVGPDTPGAGEGLGVFGDLLDIGVAGDPPDAGRLVEVGRGLGPHPGERRKRVTSVEGAVGQSDVQVGWRGDRHASTPYSVVPRPRASGTAEG